MTIVPSKFFEFHPVRRVRTWTGTWVAGRVRKRLTETHRASGRHGMTEDEVRQRMADWWAAVMHCPPGPGQAKQTARARVKDAVRRLGYVPAHGRSR